MATTREQIVTIIMKRDKLDRETAKELVDECGWAIADAIDMGLTDEIESILMDYLGLEMDYIYPFL